MSKNCLGIHPTIVFILGETYTGREFYIDSENGNDENDALTPETAWRTTKRLDEEAGFGDIVYFKRGCVYYNVEHNPQNGITYTSYGEGFKPVITGTPEYVNDSDKWELYYDENGKKIWHINLYNCTTVGWINFNLENNNHANIIYEYYDKEHGWTKTDTFTVDHSLDENLNKYGYLKDWLIATWEEAVIEEELTENLMFIDRWDNSVVEDLSIPNEDTGAQDIYLRCDEGNPAEVFSNILMATACYNGEGTKFCFDTWCKSSFVFDNISIIGAIDIFLTHCDDTIVRDCEFAYCGQNIKSMSVEEMEDFDCINLTTGGDCMYCMESAVKIYNNYIHHAAYTGIGGELFGEWNNYDTGWSMEDGVPVRRSSEFYDNVLEYTGVGFVNQTNYESEYATGLEQSPEYDVVREPISVHYNIFAYMGYDGIVSHSGQDFYSWSIFVYGMPEAFEENPGLQKEMYEKLARNICFDNNICVKSYGAICSATEDALAAMKSMSGNCYYGDPEDIVLLDLTNGIFFPFWQLK
ncbi:MAG: hypothetical protein ACI4TK_10085 [Agathobacter sp.]